MTANRILVGRKIANVIEAYSNMAGVPLREAFDALYRSNLYIEIRDGISDMHCRSDGYLAEELQLELARAPAPAPAPAPTPAPTCGISHDCARKQKRV